MSESWMAGALCAQVDLDIFFPEGQGASTRPAKRICQGCDVRAECLQYALDHEEEFGVWGGLSERQRRRLTRANATQAHECRRCRRPMVSQPRWAAGDRPGGHVRHGRGRYCNGCYASMRRAERAA